MKVKDLINSKFDLFETVFLLIFAIGFGVILLQKSYAIYTLGVGSGALAILYWFKAVQRFDDEDNKTRYSRKFVWYSLMITPIAIFSKINLYEKSDYFLLFVIILILLALIIRFMQLFNKSVVFKNEDFVRLTVALIVSFFVYILPF